MRKASLSSSPCGAASPLSSCLPTSRRLSVTLPLSVSLSSSSLYLCAHNCFLFVTFSFCGLFAVSVKLPYLSHLSTSHVYSPLLFLQSYLFLSLSFPHFSLSLSLYLSVLRSPLQPRWSPAIEMAN